MMRAIQELPSGEWEGSTFHDAFPGNPEGGLPLTVRVRIDGDAGRVELDMRDNPDCRPNGLNLSATTARSSPIAGLCFSIRQVPHNSGSFRRVSVRLRENCVVGVPVPSNVVLHGNGKCGQRVINMTQAAFAGIGQENGLAEGASGYSLLPCFAVISGTESAAGRLCVRDPALPWHKPAARVGRWLTDAELSAGHRVCAMYVDSVEADERSYRSCQRVSDDWIPKEPAGAGGAPGTVCVLKSHLRGSLHSNYSLDGAVHCASRVRGGFEWGPAEAF